MNILNSFRSVCGYRTRPEKRRFLVLGIDGVPYGLIQRLVDSGDMPTLARLRERGALMKMRSAMPPISSVAWTSFLTGVNPGKHGIYGFVERRPESYDTYFPNSHHIQTPTVWQILERHGRRCVVINVPNTYPARPMAGILIAGFVAVDLKRAIHPPAILPLLQAMDYRIDVDYRDAAEKKAAFFENLFVTLERRREAILHFLAAEPWDLFIGVFTESDRLHHFFWDEYEDGQGQFHASFLKFYRRLDEIIGEILARIGEEVGVILLSDHGFCALQSEVYVNTWLREQGYLVFRTDPPASLADLDPASRAFCLDPGRIYLNLKGHMPQGCVEPGPEAEALCLEVAEGLLGLTDGGGEKVIDRVFRKADLYRGPFEGMAPDLVLHARRGFDLKGAVNRREIFGRGKFSGMHTYDDAFLCVQNGGSPQRDVEIVDVLPTLLSAMGIPIPLDLDGSALV